jgi:hypothetical protein
MLTSWVYLAVATTSLAAAISARAAAASPPDVSLDHYNVAWDSPSRGSTGSMPLGNGDIGANVWVERGGDLVFYISKTDAWGDDVWGAYGLPKVGRVRIKLSPNPFAQAAGFSQVLRLRQGQIAITAGPADSPVHLQIWIDANHPVMHVELASARPIELSAAVEPYRNADTRHISADTIVAGQNDSVVWCHRNPSKDGPLLNHTFGAAIIGRNLMTVNDTTLHSTQPATRFDVAIVVNAGKADSVDAWVDQLHRPIAECQSIDLESARAAHQKWWQDFWNRSWIFIDGDDAAETVTRGYVLQRYVTACAGRGAYPIKFNGSIFTADAVVEHNDNGKHTRERVTADYRTWGGCYWFQNTRAMYWPMLASGDLDMMQPLFRMYENMLPLNRELVRRVYHHDGALFAETTAFSGGLSGVTDDSPPSYTGHYYTPIIELSAMMLDYYAYSGDAEFARQQLIPLADGGVTFYDQHFGHGGTAPLRIKPANAIETYWKVCNPLPDVAGLHFVLRGLLALPAPLADDAMRARWSDVLGRLPRLPMGTSQGKKVLLPFESADDPSVHNSENPELYAIYPFRLYGMGKPDLQLARDTFAARRVKNTGCWYQDPIQAAYLGDGSLARKDVLANFSAGAPELRFPAFWTAVNDYAPDEDGGGNAQNALQLMLLQCEGRQMLLLPAWPAGWNASFKLHAPLATTVEGKVADGKLQSLRVTPAERKKDLKLVGPDGTSRPLEK